MLRRQSEKLAFPWNNSYDHSILRPKFSTCFCPTRMGKDYLWDCCSFPAVMLGGHSPIHCSLSSIIRERWGEHRKPLIHTLWVQLLYEWQLKFRNLITQRQQQFREDAKRDKKIPSLFPAWFLQHRLETGMIRALLSFLILWRDLRPQPQLHCITLQG